MKTYMKNKNGFCGFVKNYEQPGGEADKAADNYVNSKCNRSILDPVFKDIFLAGDQNGYARAHAQIAALKTENEKLRAFAEKVKPVVEFYGADNFPYKGKLMRDFIASSEWSAVFDKEYRK